MAYRHPNSYATHMPVLIGLSHVLKIKSVLEYGGGYFSTDLFLNRDVFPDVESVVTCENDPVWAERVRSIIYNRGNRGMLCCGFDEQPSDKYDLVFIDADTEAHKLDLIRHTGKNRFKITVIHDSEHGPYNSAIVESFQRQFSYTSFNPETTIAWNTWGGVMPMTFNQMFAVDEIAKKYNGVDPADVQQWLKIFDSYKETLSAESSVS